MDWRTKAACRGTDPDMWFDDKPDSVRAAVKVCGSCSVREACLASAMDGEAAGEDESPSANRKNRFGVYGGMTAAERWEAAYPGLAERLRKLRAGQNRRAEDKRKAEGKRTRANMTVEQVERAREQNRKYRERHREAIRVKDAARRVERFAAMTPEEAQAARDRENTARQRRRTVVKQALEAVG